MLINLGWSYTSTESLLAVAKWNLNAAELEIAAAAPKWVRERPHLHNEYLRRIERHQGNARHCHAIIEFALKQAERMSKGAT